MLNEKILHAIYPYVAFKLGSKIAKGHHYEKVFSSLKKAILECEIRYFSEEKNIVSKNDLKNKITTKNSTLNIENTYILNKIFYLLLICEIQRFKEIPSFIEYRMQARVLSQEHNLEKIFEIYLQIISNSEGKIVATDAGALVINKNFTEECDIDESLNNLTSIYHGLDEEVSEFINDYNLKDIFIRHFGTKWVEINYDQVEFESIKSWKKIFSADTEENLMIPFIPPKYSGQVIEESFKKYESGLNNYFYINNYISSRKKSYFSEDEYKYTKKIHDLKYNHSIEYYAKVINDLLSDECILTSVPSHKKENPTGIDILVSELCKKNNRTNGSCIKSYNNKKIVPCWNQPFLIRTKTIPKKTDGFRIFRVEQDSIEINDMQRKNIENRHILLLDDVTTTGLSLAVSQMKLLDYGAKRVICLAIGKTVWI